MKHPWFVLQVVSVCWVAPALAADDGTSNSPAIAPIDAPEPPPAPAFPADIPLEETTLAGVLIAVNGCVCLDVYDGLEGHEHVFLEWGHPASREAWLQDEFDDFLSDYRGNLWEAWYLFGGGVHQSTSGMRVRTYPTGRTVGCGRRDVPVFEVESVVSAYGNHERETVRHTVDPIADELDHTTGAPQQVIAAGQSGQTVTVNIRGITDLSLGWPAWQLQGIDGQNEGANPEFSLGFVELQYAVETLAPNPDTIFANMLVERGITDASTLRNSQRNQMMEDANRRAARGPYVYRGHFTGEVLRWRGTEALYLTPVFVVTEVVTEIVTEPPAVTP